MSRQVSDAGLRERKRASSKSRQTLKHRIHHAHRVRAARLMNEAMRNTYEPWEPKAEGPSPVSPASNPRQSLWTRIKGWLA